MTSQKGRTWRQAPAMIAAAVVLALVPIAHAQTLQSERRDGGIKVRGHWVIHTLNRDGAVAERREFDNALTVLGARVLAAVLARANGVARWTIKLGANTSTTGPCPGGTFGSGSLPVPTSSCFVTDKTATPTSGTAVFPTLTTTIGGPNNDQIILSGNATAWDAGQIDFVATMQSLCPSNVAGCNLTGSSEHFTLHELRDNQGVLTPLLVTAGQIVQVTVTLSFCNSTECL